jgi:hypothetical protein
MSPAAGTPVRLHHVNGQASVLSADGLRIGGLNAALNPSRRGLVRAAVSEEAGRIPVGCRSGVTSATMKSETAMVPLRQ